MATEKSSSFVDIVEQLRMLNRLMVISLMRPSHLKLTQAELVGLLASSGASIKELARALDTTPGTVQVAISRHRKKSKGD